jgi:lipopolysaccharide export system protein LptA
MMPRHPFRFWPLLMSLILPSAMALENDRAQPLNVRAASVDLNQKSGVAVYRGNVVLTQGRLRLEADRVEVRTEKRRAQTVTATGTPVRFRGIDEDENELNGSARQVVFHAATREIQFRGDVQLRQGTDQFHADTAHYTLDDGNLTAHGAGADGRVHAVLHPRAEKNGDKTP